MCVENRHVDFLPPSPDINQEDDDDGDGDEDGDDDDGGGDDDDDDHGQQKLVNWFADKITYAAISTRKKIIIDYLWFAECQSSTYMPLRIVAMRSTLVGCSRHR